MALGRILSTAFLLTALGFPLPVLAQDAATDCSKDPISDTPLVLRRPGLPDEPLTSARIISTGSMVLINDDGSEKTFPYVQLALNNRVPDGLFDSVDEITASVMLAPGETVAGRIFRKPAAEDDTPEYEDQERIEGQVVFQAWGIKLLNPGGEYGDYAINVNHVFHLAGVRLEFGEPSGSTIPGRIRLCVAAGQTDPFGETFDTPIEVVGSFVATVE